MIAAIKPTVSAKIGGLKMEMVEKTVRLPKKDWEVIQKAADRHGRTFEEEVQWLLTADFISNAKSRQISA
jgi:hypothetical protein